MSWDKIDFLKGNLEIYWPKMKKTNFNIWFIIIRGASSTEYNISLFSGDAHIKNKAEWINF